MGKFAIINPIHFTPQHFILGKDVFIGDHGRLEGVCQYAAQRFNPIIRIGDNVSIEQNLHLTCANEIIIGRNTAIASNVSITDINHQYEDVQLPPEKQPIETLRVSIGEDCKIYNNAVLLPGTELGKHTIVGANAVVLGKKYPDYCVIVGTPAKVIKRYSFEKLAWCKTDENGNFLS